MKEGRAGNQTHMTLKDASAMLVYCINCLLQCRGMKHITAMLYTNHYAPRAQRQNIIIRGMDQFGSMAISMPYHAWASSQKGQAACSEFTTTTRRVSVEACK